MEAKKMASGCSVRDRLCAGPRGATVECVACTRTACLSCAVRVPLPDAEGRQRPLWVCHDCGVRLNPEAVRRHLSTLRGGEVTVSRVPMTAPAPLAVPRAEAWTGGAQRRWRERLPPSRSVSTSGPAPRREEGEAPAKPRPYPKARLEILGYAR